MYHLIYRDKNTNTLYNWNEVHDFNLYINNGVEHSEAVIQCPLLEIIHTATNPFNYVTAAHSCLFNKGLTHMRQAQ